MSVDEAAIQALVEERVAAILAQRETDAASQDAITAAQAEHKRRADQALMQLSASAQDESEARLKSDSFRRGGELARSPGVLAVALQEAQIIEIEVNGG